MSELSPEEKDVLVNWRRIQARRRKEWKSTPAGQWFEQSDIKNASVRWDIQRAYGRGLIDGTFDSLIEVVEGGRWITGVGIQSRLKLAGALIRWFRGDR